MSSNGKASKMNSNGKAGIVGTKTDTPVIRVDVSVLDWSLRCMALMNDLGETLTVCNDGNQIINSRENYEGEAVTSEDRVLKATEAFETHLSALIGYYSMCSDYLSNVWEHMESLDQSLASQLMLDYANNNADFITGLFGEGG